MHPLLLSLALLQPPDTLAARLRLVSEPVEAQAAPEPSRLRTAVFGTLEAGAGTATVYAAGAACALGLSAASTFLRLDVSPVRSNGFLLMAGLGLSALPAAAALTAWLVARAAGGPASYLRALLGSGIGACVGYLVTATAAIATHAHYQGLKQRFTDAPADDLMLVLALGLGLLSPTLTGAGAAVALNVSPFEAAAPTPAPEVGPAQGPPPAALMIALPALRFD